jgi:outer membrane protein assembly factor BamA
MCSIGRTLTRSWRRLFPFLYLLSISSYVSWGQTTDSLPRWGNGAPVSVLTIDTIRLEGNLHTRAQIIFRELPFRAGDTCRLPQLISWFEESKRVLMNTTLFQRVTVFADSFFGDRVSVTIRVKERFNIYPTLFFQPIDRNINQWLVEQRASLRRVNYGAQLFLNNTTGRGDRTLLTVLGGYTEQVGLSYERPYLDKNMKWGMRMGFSVGRNHEVNLETRNDKQVFLRDTELFLRKQFLAFGELQYRPRIDTRHHFGFQWRSEWVADTVRNRNPDYFPGSENRIDYPRFYYTMNFQRVDHLPYPRKGPLAQIQIARSGIGTPMDLWELHLKGMMHWPIGQKWGLAWGAYAGIKFPTDQPFVNRRFMGYGNQFVSGYEYYVVDGLAGGLSRLFLTRELVRHTIRIPYKKGKEPVTIPLRLMTRTFLQTGYVYDPELPPGGRLANTMMYSGGVGIDLLLFYDMLFRLEYSVNRFGENGLFLHRKYPF